MIKYRGRGQTHRQTNTQTCRQINIMTRTGLRVGPSEKGTWNRLTSRLYESIGPEGRYFENKCEALPGDKVYPAQLQTNITTLCRTLPPNESQPKLPNSTKTSWETFFGLFQQMGTCCPSLVTIVRTKQSSVVLELMLYCDLLLTQILIHK